MSDDAPATGLFAPRVAATADQAGYGAWRSVDAPDAVSLRFGFPYPDSFPREGLVTAAEELFAAEPADALQYGGGATADSLPAFVAGRERERGVDASAGGGDGAGGKRVVLTNGATHAIGLVARTFLGPDDAVAVGEPTFMGGLSVFRDHGPELVGVPVDGDGMDVDALSAELDRRAAAGERTPSLVYVAPTFQNPTGTTMPRGRRERLLELASEHDFVVLEDDAYGALRFDGGEVASLAALDDDGRVVRVGTFSKTIAPGVRTGWAVAHPDVAAQLDRLNVGGPSTFTKGVLGRFCESGRFAERLPELRANYEARRDRLLDALAAELPDGADWTAPDGGFFVWVTLPEGVSARELLPAAADAGVTYLPGDHFYPGEGGERRLRLSYSFAPPDALERGVAALGAALRARR
jgi:2-aminoadipate transaminase